MCIAIWSYKIDTVSMTSDFMQNSKFLCNKSNVIV